MMMTRFMTRWSIVGLCLGASLALGCDDPAPKTDDKEATKEATGDGAKADAKPAEAAGLSDSDQAELKTEFAKEAASSITEENLEAELSALEKELEADSAE